MKCGDRDEVETVVNRLKEDESNHVFYRSHKGEDSDRQDEGIWKQFPSKG